MQMVNPSIYLGSTLRWSNTGAFSPLAKGSPIPFFCNEIAEVILAHMTTEELRMRATVSKIWHQFAMRAFLFDAAFGKTKWGIHFGDIGVEPPLPPNVNQILQGACPIWPGKTVEQTHLLVLIPATTNGQPFTLKTLGELIQKPKQGLATKYRHFGIGEYQDTPVPQSYWLLMSRDVLEESRNKDWKTQFAQVAALAQKTGIPYAVPKVLEAATCILMHHVATGQKLYPNNPWTYTRCEEFYDQKNGWKLVVGGFAPGGLLVGNYCDVYESHGIGVGRKFLDIGH